MLTLKTGETLRIGPITLTIMGISGRNPQARVPGKVQVLVKAPKEMVVAKIKVKRKCG